MNYPEAHKSVVLSDRLLQGVMPRQLSLLEHWRVLRHLGTGASAQVWLLEHNVTSRQIACKTPRTPADGTLLSQEADLAASVGHENLVRSVDSQQLPDWSLTAADGIVTCWEHLPAGSLESLIAAGGPLCVKQTVTVLMAMIHVVQYLHDRHIVHGDVSPANILFDLDGRPVLIDLGAVRATAHAFNHTGTPGFVAPELMTSKTLEGLGTAADVYSLAAIGWFCLTGDIPGSPASRTPLVMLQPEIDAEIAAVLEACLAENPMLRPSLSHLLAGVSWWAEPASVDLYASAGEEYELLLPTRKPQDHVRPSDKRLRRSRDKRTARCTHLRSDPKVKDELGKPLRGWLRLLLAGSIITLISALAITVVQVRQVPDTTGPEEVSVDSVDFQAVVDHLAKARSSAWDTADVTAVAQYAAKGSDAHADDMQMLSQLHDTDMKLDGIRMRAVVEAVERSHQSAAVEVEWRTDAYVQRDQSQQVVDTTDARTEQLVLHLQETPNGWLLSSVEPISD